MKGTDRSTAKRRTFPAAGIVLLAATLLAGECFGAWVPIIGVPEPPFGANELAPAAPSPWNSQTAGYYYVCPTCTGATDSGNTYGYPALPRATVPSSLPAGAVVELHGNFSTESSRGITVSGTRSNPVFIRGTSYPSRPFVNQRWGIQGTYAIVENIWFGPLTASSTSFGISMVEGTHDVAIRNCEFSGNLNRAGSIALGTWSYGTGTDHLYNVLIDSCYIHDIGDVNATTDQDAHGVNVAGSVDNLWVVNNEITRTSGDAMQLEAQQGRRDKIHHVYYGKNHAHHNKQTGGWIKHATDVIFSQNRIHDHRTSNSSFGQCTGYQYGPEYVWFLYNEIHDCDVGIGAASNDPPGDGQNQFFIGNVIYNIHSPQPLNTYASGGIMVRGGYSVRIVGNSIYGSDQGLTAPPAGVVLDIQNNVFAGRTEASGNDIAVDSSTVSSGSTARNNLFSNASSVRINWGGTQYTSLSAFQSGTGKGEYSLSANPLFVNPADNNFHIASGSPAIDAGAAHSAYAVFRSRYGIDIAADRDAVVRPQGAAWDIGAYEYNSGFSVRKPNPPLILGIH